MAPMLQKKITLSPVSEEFVKRQLDQLNVNKSTGLDNISARFLKDAASIIVKPVTFIVNLSITTSSVPEDFKLAKVISLYKKKSCTSPGNYHPNSILSVVSKVLEKAVHVQLEEHLVKHNSIYQFQSGFRQKFSTETALINLLDSMKPICQKATVLGCSYQICVNLTPLITK